MNKDIKTLARNAMDSKDKDLNILARGALDRINNLWDYFETDSNFVVVNKEEVQKKIEEIEDLVENIELATNPEFMEKLRAALDEIQPSDEEEKCQSQETI